MHLLLSAALLLQTSVTIGVGNRDTSEAARDRRAAQRDSLRAKRDSVKTTRDSIAAARAARRRAERAKQLTPEVLRAAFANEATHRLYLRARAARTEQDSALLAYDTRTYQRVSAHIGFARVGRDRLIFRKENAARVRWQRDRGAWVEVTGSRTTLPSFKGFAEVGDELRDELDSEVSPSMVTIPYFPGREGIWVGSDGLAKAEVEDTDIIHPLAEGAELYYRFSAGDSLSIRTGEGRRFTIREMRVTPRAPRWNLIVGSFWFDTESGRLVRSAYRLAEHIDAFKVAKEVDDEDPDEDIPLFVRPLVTPIIVSIDAITEEYGLYEGRFWLPRVRVMEGSGRMSFIRMRVAMEESFRYASVNGRLDSLPTLRTAEEQKRVVDSIDVARKAREAERKRLREDTTAEGKRQLAAFDSTVREERRRRRERACEDGLLTSTQERHEGAVRVSASVPCDQTRLASSPDLPKSPYDPGDELFDSSELEALKEKVLSLATQPGFAPQKPELYYSAELWRYNRVEGFSPAAAVRQRFGAGYTGELVLRIGLADLQPNGELTLARTAARRTVQVTGYRRLAAANDFGNPLSFGASLGAALFGRDEGFYYRTAGAELAVTGEGNPFLGLRFFAERHDAAEKETDVALPHLFSGGEFIDNITADEGTITGAALRIQSSHGEDPEGFRLLSDLRAEGAGGAWLFGRALGDVTLSRGFGRRAAGALTLSGGAAGGEVPVQRLFYLGGSQTVRGQRAGSAIGNAFWMTRAELGSGFVGVRPTIFFDAGWAGDRADWQHPGRPLSGAGVGASFMDGLFRFDLARGIYPRQQVRLDLYLEARF
ncbi:MAG: ShlB/FhaC/HecB family hemolysin secretion/activation protein [Gemmatimonadaceae bacterium]